MLLMDSRGPTLFYNMIIIRVPSAGTSTLKHHHPDTHCRSQVIIHTITVYSTYRRDFVTYMTYRDITKSASQQELPHTLRVTQNEMKARIRLSVQTRHMPAIEDLCLIRRRASTSGMSSFTAAPQQKHFSPLSCA